MRLSNTWSIYNRLHRPSDPGKSRDSFLLADRKVIGTDYREGGEAMDGS